MQERLPFFTCSRMTALPSTTRPSIPVRAPATQIVLIQI
jgi:hypothetical protein